MKRPNIGAIALLGSVMIFVGVRALINDSMVISRRRWPWSGPDVSMDGGDLKAFGILWLVLGLLTLGVALGLWMKSRE